MIKYSCLIKNKNNYEIISVNSSVNKLINEINNDDISYINDFKDNKFKKLIDECKIILIKFLDVYRIELKNTIHRISKC